MPRYATQTDLAVSRARIAGLARLARRSGDPTDVDAERARYRALKLEAFIHAVVANGPPLSATQVDRLSRLLRSGAR